MSIRIERLCLQNVYYTTDPRGDGRIFVIDVSNLDALCDLEDSKES